MNAETIALIASTQTTVTQLVERCSKQRPLYRASPKAVAQISRIGKWLLNAIAALNKAINGTSEKENSQ